MKIRVQLLSPFLVAALTACALAPEVLAQCSTGAREFASVGGMQTQKLRIRTEGWHNGGQEFGRFWSATNSGNNNNFGGQCPSNDASQVFGPWWSDETGNANCDGMPCYGIRGALSGTNCGGSTCNDEPLIVLIEDWAASGPPGIRETAYFFAARVDLDADGAVSPRRWDFALVDDPTHGQLSQGLVEGTEFPTVTLISWAPAGLRVQTEQDYDDPGPGVWAVVDTLEGLPDSSVVVSYDICWIEGTDDPGRDRSLWTCVESLPYLDGPVVGNIVQVSCKDYEQNDAFFAIGMTFDGGAGPDVPSRLVGRATRVECNPFILAEPELRRRIPRKSPAPRTRRR